MDEAKWEEFARQLERDLAAANAIIDRLNFEAVAAEGKLAEAQKLLSVAESAAMTAHYHNYNFCHGRYENCEKCKSWRNTIEKARRVLAGEVR